MNLARLAWRFLWSRPLVAALNLLMLALGFGAMVLVTLVGDQLERQAQRDLAGVDLVVGAKGSPLQLILAGVFHVDVPTGNIPLATLAQMSTHPLVAQAVPLSLGDGYKGFRIVGTTPDYLGLYRAALQTGRMWQQPMEAVLGARVARETGQGLGRNFAGAHGLGRDGDAHADRPFTVVGTLAPCGCVLDRLVLTATESVWAVHEHHEAAGAEPDAAHDDAEREITIVLLKYRTPLAAATLPRWVNAQDRLQAAAPALESARLFRTIGAGLDVMRGFAIVLLAVAALSVFVALLHAVREREPDLAMLRMLGAPARRVAALLVFEALWLTALGLALGVALGHGLTHLLGLLLAAERSLPLTGWWWTPQHGPLLVGAVVLVMLAVAVPVRRALRLDVTTLLQTPR